MTANRPSTELVAEFLGAFGVERLGWETTPALRRVKETMLRLHLLNEELSELLLGMYANDRVEILDALADLEYSLVGAGLVLGADPTHWLAPENYGEVSALDYVGNLQDRLAGIAYNWNHPRSLDHNLGRAAAALSGLWTTLGMQPFRSAALAEVHRSNMSKLGPDGQPVMSPAGRLEKGPNYSPPNLEKVLNG